jgi:hypothetical protein
MHILTFLREAPTSERTDEFTLPWSGKLCPILATEKEHRRKRKKRERENEEGGGVLQSHSLQL